MKFRNIATVSTAATVSAIALGTGGAQAAATHIWDSSNINDYSLLSRDFSPKAKAALKGATGQNGATGRRRYRRHWRAGSCRAAGGEGRHRAGAPGAAAEVVYVTRTLTVPAGPNSVGDFATIPCPEATKVITGSASGSVSGNLIYLQGRIDVAHNGWVFSYWNDLPTHDVSAVVVCA